VNIGGGFLIATIQLCRVEDWRAGLGRSSCSLLTRPFVCECHSISTMLTFPIPATSNVAYGFPAYTLTCLLHLKGSLLRKLKEIFRRYRSQPTDRLIQLINPILRGWVNYFAVGNSSECFGFIRDWVEKKVRRQMMRAGQRKGFGWTRWSRQWLYNTLKLFNGYKVKRLQPKVAPAG
jgi:Group II intron, maturase-specific domain